MYQFDILDCAPTNITLRDVQKKALLKFQEDYEKSDVLVINMPVGAGKSIVAMTAAEWMRRNGLGHSALVTPTKILMDQYAKDFDWIPLLKGMDSYPCAVTEANNCKSTKRIFGKCCGPNCKYLMTKTMCHESPVSIYNLHSYYFNEMWKRNVTIDESHNISGFISDMHSVKLWQPEWKYDPEIETTIDNVKEIVLAALLTLKEQYTIALTKKIESQLEELEKEVARYTSVYNLLALFGNDVLIVKKEEVYEGKAVKSAKGKPHIVIYVKPLKIASLVEGVLWPSSKTNKVVLMSATISPIDVAEFGLANEKVSYFECDSPIPKENRPFVAIPVAPMTYKHQEESIPVIAEYIKKLAARHPNDKGLVHCTYSVAVKLQKFLGNESRFIFHDKYNKNQKYQEFRNATHKANAILVASGMSEGIDLPDDCARWQIITQVQYPNLKDDVSQWECHNAPDLYKWRTVRTIIQQSGRICRSPTDHGTTYIIDSEFKRLWGNTQGKGMWPRWFTEAVKWIKFA